MKSGIFVSGTDTGVGKTLVSSFLMSGLRHAEILAGYFKPIQTGDDLDFVTVSKLLGIAGEKPDSPNLPDLPGSPDSKIALPCYCFPDPLAPSRAAALQNVEIQLDYVLSRWNQLDDRHWVVEGAGGLLVPLNTKQTMRELIQILCLNLVVVASTRLGTINHTLLTLEAAISAGIDVRGVILVGPEDLGLEEVLRNFTQVPILTRIPHYEAISPELIVKEGPKYITPEVLRKIYK